MEKDNTALAPRLSLAPEARLSAAPAASIRFYRVRDFEKLQHYKNRNPPWVKLYRELILDYEFQQYDEVTRFHSIALLILASTTGNKIPNDPRWVGAQIGAHAPVDLARLYEIGLLEPWQPRLQEPGPGEQLDLPEGPPPAANPSSDFVLPDASNLASNLASTERETDTDTEAEPEAEPEAHTEADTAAASAARLCSCCGVSVCSGFSYPDALDLVRLWKREGRLVGGKPIENPGGLARTIHREGTADDEIRLLKHPPPRREFTDEACPTCYGSKFKTVPGKGAEKCPDCVDEMGVRTGKRAKDAGGRGP